MKNSTANDEFTTTEICRCYRDLEVIHYFQLFDLLVFAFGRGLFAIQMSKRESNHWRAEHGFLKDFGTSLQHFRKNYTSKIFSFQLCAHRRPIQTSVSGIMTELIIWHLINTFLSITSVVVTWLKFDSIQWSTILYKWHQLKTEIIKRI